jgi:hypothetical protein
MALVQVLAGLALASAPGPFDDPPAVAPVLSIGGGYAVPFGRLFESSEIDVNNAMKGGFPVRAEVGVALWGRWHLVAYGEYAFLDRSQRCVPTADCTGNAIHLGGQLQYWGTGLAGWRAFIGLGGGWEKLSLDTPDTSFAFSGFEGKLTGAVLYFFGDLVGIGPYMDLGVGGYSHLDAAVGSGTGSETIRNQAVHVWLTFGVRIDLWL